MYLCREFFLLSRPFDNLFWRFRSPSRPTDRRTTCFCVFVKKLSTFIVDLDSRKEFFMKNLWSTKTSFNLEIWGTGKWIYVLVSPWFRGRRFIWRVFPSLKSLHPSSQPLMWIVQGFLRLQFALNSLILRRVLRRLKCPSWVELLKIFWLAFSAAKTLCKTNIEPTTPKGNNSLPLPDVCRQLQSMKRRRWVLNLQKSWRQPFSKSSQ